MGADGDGTRQIGADDEGFGHVADATVVETLLEPLPPREQEIVRLRFYEELSQSEIAERIGISQMHVSRLLRRSFEQMRRRGQAATTTSTTTSEVRRVEPSARHRPAADATDRRPRWRRVPIGDGADAASSVAGDGRRRLAGER